MSNKVNIWAVYSVIFFALILPMVFGIYFQSLQISQFINVPFHSFLESIGAFVGVLIATLLLIFAKKSDLYDYVKFASLSILSMSIFDAIHSILKVGELFVLLNGLSILSGGFIASLVWFSDIKISYIKYTRLFFTLLLFIIVTVTISYLNEDLIPQMINSNGTFSKVANLLNIAGGSLFILASLFFVKKYLENGNDIELFLMGHSMLFGTAGLLFIFSNIWNIEWWLWHILKFSAYSLTLIYFLILLYSYLKEIFSKLNTLENENKTLKESLNILSEYKRAMNEGSIVSIGNRNGIITYVNDELLKVTGYEKEEVIGKPHSIFRHPDTPKDIFKNMWKTIESKEIWRGVLKNIKKDGNYIFIKITIVPILNNSGEILEYIAFRDDITELMNSQENFKSMFYTDHLTKLYNRLKLLEDVKRADNPFIAIFNIDSFKQPNDFYGDEFGDKIIQTIANKLFEEFSDVGFKLYRNHADEFTLIYDYKIGINFIEFLERIKIFLNSINESKIVIDEEELNITLSVGISKDTTDLVNADLALKEAKKSKKSIVVFDDNLQIKNIYRDNLEWTKKIKSALSEDRVKVALQPIYNINDSEIEKYEALVRIIDENGEEISPSHFLDVAKQTRLYLEITKRVVQKVFKILNEVDKEISINISAQDIIDEETKEFILNNLKESKNSNRVVFELVESEGIETFSTFKEFVEKLKEFNCKLAIDDFGTGYSNFDYLMKLEANYIKIDGSLIKDIDINASKANLVETIVTFAKKNGLKTVGEFVADKSIFDKLRVLKVDYAQGYYIGKPKLWN